MSVAKFNIESVYDTIEVDGTFMVERRHGRTDRRKKHVKVAYDRRIARDKRIPCYKHIDETV